MKVLVSAYACEPYKGSEQGVGWQWVRQISRIHDTYVITRANNQSIIEEEICRHPNGALHFVYVDLPRWASFWKRGEKGLYLYYYFWQITAYRLAERLHKEIAFDLSHHLTFGNIWLPTFLWRLPIPFIWGPVGGYETIPSSFLGSFPFKGKLYEAFRHALLFWTRNLDPISRMAARKASFIVGRTAATSKALSFQYPGKVVTMLETGVSQMDFADYVASSEMPANSKRLNVLMVGRLIPLKGFNLGIEAFKILIKSHPEATLHIVGAGPEADSLKRSCYSVELSEKVVFYGRLPYGEVLKHYKKADIFLHPSLKEGGAWVVFEAMAAGLPVVCFDNSGPGEVVTESSGIKVAAYSPKQAVADLSAALKRLADNVSERQALGHGALLRLQDFTWEKKGEFIDKIYSEAIKKDGLEI